MRTRSSIDLGRRIAHFLGLTARILLPSLLGIWIIILASVYYAYTQNFMHYLTPERATIFQKLAYSYLVMLFLGVLLIGIGLLRHLNQRITIIKKLDSIQLSLGSLIPYIFSQRRYLHVFIASTLLYGLFYSFVTSIIVYQPTLNFSEAYSAEIPSVFVIPCCGALLYVPVVVVYLTEHLGLLLIPLSLILLIIVSTLVGLNLALTSFSYTIRLRKNARGWLGGFGAFVGLFTGCPTCAGLFFAYIVGGAGAVTAATLLANYQPLFIGMSIPVLAVTPLLISRSLSKLSGGCVVPHAKRTNFH